MENVYLPPCTTSTVERDDKTFIYRIAFATIVYTLSNESAISMGREKAPFI